MSDTCKRLVYWGQFGPTCWFNTLLMVVFYSQLSRERVMQASKNWNKKLKIYKIFNHILKYKFVKSKNPEKDHKFFEKIKAENILKMLHNYNPKFIFNPSKYKNRGFSSDFYIKRFYKMLGVSSLFLIRFDSETVGYNTKNNIDYKTFDLGTKKGKGIFFQTINKTATYVQNKLKLVPDVLFIECKIDAEGSEDVYRKTLPHYVFKNKELASMNDTIVFNNTVYKLDSVLLNNWNQPLIDKGHAIAGITCNNERYVYNGWTRYTTDRTMVGNTTGLSIPCELMKYPWDVKRHQDFCINLQQCKLDNTGIKKNDMCFSFNKGKRTLIYVKKPVYDVNMHIVQTPEYVSFGKSPKNCEDGKVLNPKTGRCIKVKLPKGVKEPKAAKSAVPIHKPCPPGKMRNPKTGRCVKAKAQEKECPPGKVRDPVSKRCIMLATAKKRKLL